MELIRRGRGVSPYSPVDEDSPRSLDLGKEACAAVRSLHDVDFSREEGEERGGEQGPCPEEDSTSIFDTRV